jgi:hypothetical protein
MRVNHSKYKNTGILFELLIRQITTDTLEGVDSPAREILHTYFVKSELGKEYKLYENLMKNTSLTEGKANMVISSLIEVSKTLNKGSIKRQKYNLIKEIQKHYDLNKFFNHKLPNYKSYAAFYTLLELYSSPTPNTDQLIQNKVTLMESLTNNNASKEGIKNEILEELNNSDKEIKLLTYKILLEKFNEKYGDLNSKQKLILREYLNSIDNKIKLKEFYNTTIQEILTEIKSNIDVIDNEITKIKIEEVISLIKPLTKEEKIKDSHLVDLLQYCDLIQEIKKVHEPA